ncbi:MAG: hypothetical protein ACKO22_03975, partial [Cyanobium sp.]
VSATVKVEYDYTDTDPNMNEQILFSTSLDQSNYFEVQNLIKVQDPILDDSLLVDPRQKISANMICSDGSYVKPPAACKRRS